MQQTRKARTSKGVTVQLSKYFKLRIMTESESIKYTLHHPKIGTLKQVFETEIEAKKHLTGTKNRGMSNKDANENFKKFIELGWRIEVNILTKIEN